MIDGILLINKEQDITSYDVIRKLKKILPKGQKIGHAGTLDPFATGLLIILLGKSTKKMVSILEMKKEYLVKAEFGYATDTQDITGKKTVHASPFTNISKENIEEIIQREFVGEISQTPPQYSAKKIKGKKAYEFARRNEEVKLEPKQVTVYEFKVEKYEWPYVQFKIVCSSGTYVRTLIHDLGLNTGVFATAIDLERKSIGDFNVDNALNSKDINEKLDINLIVLDYD